MICRVKHMAEGNARPKKAGEWWCATRVQKTRQLKKKKTQWSRSKWRHLLSWVNVLHWNRSWFINFMNMLKKCFPEQQLVSAWCILIYYCFIRTKVRGHEPTPVSFLCWMTSDEPILALPSYLILLVADYRRFTQLLFFLYLRALDLFSAAVKLGLWTLLLAQAKKIC